MDDSGRHGRAADSRGNKRPHKPSAWKRDLLTGKQTREEKKVKASIEILKWKKVTTRMVKFGGGGGGGLFIHRVRHCKLGQSPLPKCVDELKKKKSTYPWPLSGESL